MSISVNDCLHYVVGLSRTNCSCDYYASCQDFDESESGLYIDELSPLNTEVVNARADCEKGTLCNIMDIARSNAIKKFRTDVHGLILRTHKVNKERYNQAIGKKEYTGTLSLTSTYQVARFNMKDVVGGTFDITSIWAGFDTTVAFNLYVYNNLNELVTTLALASQANTWNQNTVSLSLPTHSKYTDDLEYFFVYQVSALGNPFNNVLQGTDKACKPCHETMTNKHNGYKRWLEYSGSGKSDLDFSDWVGTGSDYMGGLIFEVDLKCDISKAICDEELDFTSDPVALGIAQAIQYKAGIELIDLIISSPELERKVLINRDTMLDYRVLFDTKYKELMYYDRAVNGTGLIERGLKIKNTDCFRCFDNWGIRKATILT